MPDQRVPTGPAPFSVEFERMGDITHVRIFTAFGVFILCADDMGMRRLAKAFKAEADKLPTIQVFRDFPGDNGHGRPKP